MKREESAKASTPKILLVGYVGGINVGDEAIAGVVAKTLIDKYNAKIAIVSGQPKLTASYLNLECEVIKGFYPGPQIRIKEYFQLITAVRNTDIIMFAGGGILQDVHSASLLTHCSLFALLGRIYNKKVVALGTGVGPINSKKGQSLGSLFLQNIDFMFVRDQFSFDVVEEKFNKHLNKIRLGSDSIFLLPPNIDSLGFRPTKKIGLCYRNWSDLDFYNLENIVSEIISNEKTPIFIAYEKDDIILYNKLAEKFYDKIILRDCSTLKEDLEQIRALDGLISMRLHASLFAIKHQVPFVAISYDPKIENVISKAGFSNQVFNLNENPSRLIEGLSKTDFSEENRENIKTTYYQVIDNITFLLNERFNTKLSFSDRFLLHLKAIKFTFSILIIPILKENLLLTAGILSKFAPLSWKEKVKRIVGIRW